MAKEKDDPLQNAMDAMPAEKFRRLCICVDARREREAAGKKRPALMSDRELADAIAKALSSTEKEKS